MEALAAVGPIVQGIGGFVASRQQSGVLKAQAREEVNAAAAQGGRLREAARKAIGEQLAGQAANGFLGGTGSALDSVLESQANAVLDAMTVQREAVMKARGLRAEAKMKRTEGLFSLASGLVGAASSVGGMRDDWAQAKTGASAGMGT